MAAEGCGAHGHHTAAVAAAARRRALLESFRRADLKAQRTFVHHELDAETQATLFGSVYDNITTGALKVHTAVAGGAELVGAFFSSLVGTGKGGEAAASIPAEVVTPEGATPGEAVSRQPQEVEHSRPASNVSASSAQTESSAAQAEAGATNTPDPGLERRSGTYRVDYQVGLVGLGRLWDGQRAATRSTCQLSGAVAPGSSRKVGAGGAQRRALPMQPLPQPPPTLKTAPQKYPIAGYVKLPAALQPFVQLPYLDHVIVVAKPSGDISGGLEHYREVRPASGAWQAVWSVSFEPARPSLQVCYQLGSRQQPARPLCTQRRAAGPSPAVGVQARAGVGAHFCGHRRARQARPGQGIHLD